MQVLVDRQYHFMDIYIGWPGCAHDGHVLAISDTFNKGEAATLLPNKQKNICGKYVLLLILGDPAYPLLPRMMKQYRFWKIYSKANNGLVPLDLLQNKFWLLLEFGKLA